MTEQLNKRFGFAFNKRFRRCYAHFWLMYVEFLWLLYIATSLNIVDFYLLRSKSQLICFCRIFRISSWLQNFCGYFVFLLLLPQGPHTQTTKIKKNIVRFSRHSKANCFSLACDVLRQCFHFTSHVVLYNRRRSQNSVQKSMTNFGKNIPDGINKKRGNFPRL